jgi:hypothetical protein
LGSAGDIGDDTRGAGPRVMRCVPDGTRH